MVGTVEKVAVLGAGSWGTVLAVVAARAGRSVALWLRDPDRAAGMERERRNQRFLPDLRLPPTISVTADLAAACDGAGVVLFVVPTHAMRETTAAFAALGLSPVVVSAAKGLERGTLRRMTEIIAAAAPHLAPDRIAAISGPNLAGEIAAGHPAATVVAASAAETAEMVRTALMTDRFRLYTHDDVVGVEVGGALKNVIALGAGMGDALGAGENAKAAFATRGLAEIARLGVALGANPLTFSGLAGVGDLIATCASPHSRNRRAGQLLAEGLDVDEVRLRLGQVAEGIATADAAWELGRRLGVDLPITDQVRAVVWHGKPPLAAVAELMGRDPRRELDGISAKPS